MEEKPPPQKKKKNQQKKPNQKKKPSRNSANVVCATVLYCVVYSQQKTQGKIQTTLSSVRPTQQLFQVAESSCWEKIAEKYRE